MTVEEKLANLGYRLPNIPPSKGIYKSCLIDGNHIYVSGHVSLNEDGSYITGKLGKDISEDAGKIAARQCGLAILVSMKKELGDLDKIKRVIKLLGMVNATPEYEKHPLVINGCSELFVELWGDDNGKGVRSAVGMGSLPNNVSVEIEAMFELK
ncbi:MAG: RidA family protein [Sphingobacteriales bacterium]|nr:RidA family protein [Sphingobacteriales bacterium]MBI3720538.1 RidA family protein [Sphingobacteriales bacterium]